MVLILCCTRGSNFSAGAWTPVLSHSLFLCLHPEGTNLSYHFFKIMSLTWNTVFPRIIAGGDYFFVSSKKGAIIWRRRLFKILLIGSRALNILLYFPIKSKNNHVKYTEHGLFKYSKFISLINFQSLNRHWSVLLSLIALQLDREDKRKRRWREGRGRDDYSWEAVSSSTSHLQKVRNLREGLGIDSWRGRFTWKWRDEDKQSLTNFRQIRRPFGFIFQYSSPMERQEVVLSDGDGFQSTQTLFKRVMAVCYIQTVITVIKNSRKTDRLKWAVLFCSKLV